MDSLTLQAVKAMPAASLKPITLPGGAQTELAQARWDRITAKIVESDSGCWEWTGRLIADGYGAIRIERRTVYLHRLTYMALVGEIPTGLHIDHLCRNRACCNPAHLEPVTCRENVLRSPVAPAAINARKKACKRGHPFTEENTGKATRGRACRKCKREAQYRWAAANPEKARRSGISSTHCEAGHLMDEANTYTYPSGRPACRACRRKWSKNDKRSARSSNSRQSENPNPPAKD